MKEAAKREQTYQNLSKKFCTLSCYKKIPITVVITLIIETRGRAGESAPYTIHIGHETQELLAHLLEVGKDG